MSPSTFTKTQYSVPRSSTGAPGPVIPADQVRYVDANGRSMAGTAVTPTLPRSSRASTVGPGSAISGNHNHLPVVRYDRDNQPLEYSQDDNKTVTPSLLSARRSAAGATVLPYPTSRAPSRRSLASVQSYDPDARFVMTNSAGKVVGSANTPTEVGAVVRGLVRRDTVGGSGASFRGGSAYGSEAIRRYGKGRAEYCTSDCDRRGGGSVCDSTGSQNSRFEPRSYAPSRTGTVRRSTMPQPLSSIDENNQGTFPPRRTSTLGPAAGHRPQLLRPMSTRNPTAGGSQGGEYPYSEYGPPSSAGTAKTKTSRFYGANERGEL